MADNLRIYGETYTGVLGIKAVDTDGNTLTFVKQTETAVTIVAQPVDVTVIAGETATVSVGATGDNLTYQWQYSTNSGTSWTNCSGTGYNTATFSWTTTTSHNGRLYRCRVSDGTNTVTSNAASVTVLESQAAQTIHPSTSDQTIAAGKYLAGAQTIKAVTTTNLSASNILSGVTVKIGDSTDDDCVASVTGTAVPSGSLTIVTQPLDTTVIAGETATVRVGATGSNLTYQWQYSTNGGTSWTNNTGTGYNTDTFSWAATASHNGRLYRCVVSDGTDTVTSNAATITVLTTQAAQTIHPSTSDQTIASGKYLTGAQTVKGVVLTNLLASVIKKDEVVKIGDSTDDDCVASVTGTYEGSGGGVTESVWMAADEPTDDNLHLWIDLDSDLGLDVQLYLGGTGTIDWGDGNTDSSNTSWPKTHSYAANGVYEIVVSGAFTVPVNNTIIQTNPYLYKSRRLLRRAYVPAMDIGQYKFQNCYGLEKVTIKGNGPQGTATTIGMHCFSPCYALREIIIPEGVSTLAANAFLNTMTATYVSIPSTCTEIGISCFNGCGSLEFHIAATTPPNLLNTNAFNNGQSGALIYVPYSSDHSVLSAYENATNWSTLYANGKIVEESA